jgi:hypothetical protein
VKKVLPDGRYSVIIQKCVTVREGEGAHYRTRLTAHIVSIQVVILTIERFRRFASDSQ